MEFNKSAHIKIGDNCLLSYGVVIAIKDHLCIGNDVMIGEYTSIRDFTHNHNLSLITMNKSKDIISSIIIGNNVWIGRGCIIMPGANIEDGVVIGANSVVKGHFKKESIYAGSPIKLLKTRK